ncbi:MAG: GGDEF-domain containing protein, partial [Chromatocurvus sp.]
MHDLDPDRAKELSQRVFQERLSLYFDSLSASIFAVVVNSLLLAYLLWTPENGNLVLGWCIATLVLATYRV